VVDRVEAWQPEERFDAVISRAFSDLPEFAQLAGRLRAPAGELLAMKGVHPYEEVLQLPAEAGEVEVVKLDVPGLDGERHLVRVRAPQ
jgi:16S rRNA (guanine527-N7)-methyltransferase